MDVLKEVESTSPPVDTRILQADAERHVEHHATGRKVSQRRLSAIDSLAEEEQDKAMTQSLVIPQQCAVEQLKHYEDGAEKEDEVTMLLPEANAGNRANIQQRRKSGTRLVRMFSGLPLVTDLPTPTTAPLQPLTRAERASLWLDGILALEDEQTDPIPGGRDKSDFHLLARQMLPCSFYANGPIKLLT